MPSILIAIILIIGAIVALFSPSMIRFFSHRPANGELKTLSRLSEKVDKLSKRCTTHCPESAVISKS